MIQHGVKLEITPQQVAEWVADLFDCLCESGAEYNATPQQMTFIALQFAGICLARAGFVIDPNGTVKQELTPLSMAYLVNLANLSGGEKPN